MQSRLTAFREHFRERFSRSWDPIQPFSKSAVIAGRAAIDGEPTGLLPDLDSPAVTSADREEQIVAGQMTNPDRCSRKATKIQGDTSRQPLSSTILEASIGTNWQTREAVSNPWHDGYANHPRSTTT